jgi:hypothetical protein
MRKARRVPGLQLVRAWHPSTPRGSLAKDMSPSLPPYPSPRSANP